MRVVGDALGFQIANTYRAIQPLLDASDAQAFVGPWWAEEDQCTYWCGCPDYDARPALIFTIEAARGICGVDYGYAIRLLRRAIVELEAQVDQP